jgi:hypothetical protein
MSAAESPIEPRWVNCPERVAGWVRSIGYAKKTQKLKVRTEN